MRNSALKPHSQPWGEDPSLPLKEDCEPKDEHVSPIRGGLVTLTGNHYRAVILNQLLYWTPRVKDFDLMLEEEKTCHQGYNTSPRYGWIYKTAEELIKETLLCVDRTSIRRYLNFLIKKEWVFQRTNPFNKWDKTTQYRINPKKIQKDLLALGQSLPDAYTKGFGETFSEIAEISSERKARSSGQNNRSNGYDAPSNGEYALLSEQVSLKPAETSNGQNAPSSGQNNRSNGYDAPSNGEYALLSERSSLKPAETSNGQNAPSSGQNNRSNGYDAPSNGESVLSSEQPSLKPVEMSNGQNAPSSGQNNRSNGHGAPSNGEYVLSSEQLSLKPAETSNGQNAPSSGQNNHSNGYGAPSNGQNARSNTKTTIKNTNKEHTQDACAREDFENSSLMVDLWCKHIGQEVRLTEERKHQLETLFCQHFQSNMQQWEQFCERIKWSPFLMGKGPRKWHVTLDWVLNESNLRKILKGKFDNPESLELKKSESTKASCHCQLKIPR